MQVMPEHMYRQVSAKPNKPGSVFWIVLGAIVFCGGWLRFYQLGAIKEAVFDEVHFARYGYDYLVGTQFLHVHPPLYNYLSSLSIWLYYHVPGIGNPAALPASFEQLDALSYRWINALAGTALIGLAGLCAWQISRLRLVALLVACFVAVDGALVVDSRFALNNIFLPVFGFLAFSCIYQGLCVERRPKVWLFAGGICLGCVISVKWNGLGYLLALFALLGGLKLFRATDRLRPARPETNSGPTAVHQGVSRGSLWVCLLVVPLLVYCLLWIPDRMFNTQFGFLGIHQQIFNYHSGDITVASHPYCSKWYSWPLMERPISYYFKVREAMDAAGQPVKLFSDIHLFGNPVLYWLSFASILAMGGHWCWQCTCWFRTGQSSLAWLITTVTLLGFGANLLPWVLVSRCTFLYHYESASIFAFLALAWYCARAWLHPSWWVKGLGLAVLLAVGVAFVHWLPLMLGSELPMEQYYRLMWFRRWI
jgi:dolichyl-phosphate-mannose-protein mannosyltransferase